MRTLLLTGMLWAAFASSAQAAPGALRGEILLELPGTTLASLGPVVVYLDPVDAPPSEVPPPARVRITQSNATFSPAFQVVTVGQTVEMPNQDMIYHNVFSFSRPNDFDLGIYPAGESRSIRFGHPGVVKTYCSIHENMNATIVVVPSPHFDVVGGSGSFSIEGVLPGRYRVRTWCEKLPETIRDVTISPGESLSLVIDLTP